MFLIHSMHTMRPVQTQKDGTNSPPPKLGPESWDMVGMPKKAGGGVVAAPRKLEVDAGSHQKAGCPSKLPFQAPKAGFN